MTNKTKNRFNMTPYLFIAPVFILLAALVVYPICYALYLSVLDTNLTTRWDFVGLKNYISIFKNGNMVKSLLTTFEFTVVVVAGHLVLGTVLADYSEKSGMAEYFYGIYYSCCSLYLERLCINHGKYHGRTSKRTGRYI